MPQLTAKPVEKESPDLKNLKNQEKKALSKLERINTWPAEHRKVAKSRTEETLSQIRSRMKKLAN